VSCPSFLALAHSEVSTIQIQAHPSYINEACARRGKGRGKNVFVCNGLLALEGADAVGAFLLDLILGCSFLTRGVGDGSLASAGPDAVRGCLLHLIVESGQGQGDQPLDPGWGSAP